MVNCIRKYKGMLKQNLHCSSTTRKQLLQKFELMLSTFTADLPTPNMDDLRSAFGSPKEMASILMEEVSAEEIAQHRKKTIFLRVLCGLFAAVVIAGAVYIYFYKEVPVKSNDYVVIDETSGEDGAVVAKDAIIVDDEFTIED